jgi:hypothetical protein
MQEQCAPKRRSFIDAKLWAPAGDDKAANLAAVTSEAIVT